MMTVEITCPNCNFSKGLPREKIPKGVRWAICPRCKQRFDLLLPPSLMESSPGQEMKGQPGEPQRIPSPWENRSELGICRGIYQTSRSALFFPKHFYRHMTFEGSIGEPLAFGVLFGSVGTMMGLFWQFFILTSSLFPTDWDLFGPHTVSIIFVGIMILSPVFAVISLLVTSGICHLLLLILRGGKNGFKATFRVLSFAQTTQILGLIPFIGAMIGGLWFLIILVIGLKEIHGTSYTRIVLALLLPLAVILMMGMGLWMIFH